jgi:hypothetical protein
MDASRNFAFPAFSVETEATEQGLFLVVAEDIQRRMTASNGYPESIVGKCTEIISSPDLVRRGIHGIISQRIRTL